MGAVVISFSAIFFALSEVSPATGTFFRAAYALPVLFVLWLIRRRQDRRPISARWIAVGAGLALGADIFAWHVAISYIGAGLATLLANTSVIFVALGAWVLFGERPRNTTMAMIPLILVGVTMVSGIGNDAAFGTNPVAGAFLALLAAMFYATFLLGFRHSNASQGPAAGPLMEATLGAVIASFAIGMVGPGIQFDVTWPGHGWLLALALGAQVFGWLMIGYALPRLPAVETATIILIQPVLTILWGALIFGERPSPLQIGGAVIVLVGVAVVAVVRADRIPEPIA